jgi:hypothetical protein
MRIWRIDATFPGDEVQRDGTIVEDVVGMLTVFAQTEPFCEIRRRELDDAGWEYDVYAEEIGEPELGVMGRLLLCPWPVLPTSLILTLCASPVPIAREQLDALLVARGLPRLKTGDNIAGDEPASESPLSAVSDQKELKYEPCDDG